VQAEAESDQQATLQIAGISVAHDIAMVWVEHIMHLLRTTVFLLTVPVATTISSSASAGGEWRRRWGSSEGRERAGAHLYSRVIIGNPPVRSKEGNPVSLGTQTSSVVSSRQSTCQVQGRQPSVLGNADVLCGLISAIHLSGPRKATQCPWERRRPLWSHLARHRPFRTPSCRRG